MNIKEMFAMGITISEIAHQTGRDRKTIRKIINGQDKRKYQRAVHPSLLDSFKPYIVERMSKGVMNATKIYGEIEKMGYQGKISILRDFIQPLRPIAESRYTVRFETLPGEQAQCDWGSFGTIIENETQQRLYCFVMVLSYSRMMYIEFTTRMDEGALLRCHINSFNYFGGIPSKILYDNQKTVVTGRDAEGYPIWNERFNGFNQHYGFIPKLCRPYRARTKGKVERLVRYVRENFFCGIDYLDLNDLNHQAMTWLNQTANCRVHQTTQAIPFERWQEELLQPVSVNPFDMATYTQRRVSMDCLISYQRNYYSVPWMLAGRDLLIRLNEGSLEAIFDGRVVASHQSIQGKHQRVINPEHFQGIRGNQKKNRLAALKLAAAQTNSVEVRSLLVYENLVS